MSSLHAPSYAFMGHIRCQTCRANTQYQLAPWLTCCLPRVISRLLLMHASFSSCLQLRCTGSTLLCLCFDEVCYLCSHCFADLSSIILDLERNVLPGACCRPFKDALTHRHANSLEFLHPSRGGLVSGPYTPVVQSIKADMPILRISVSSCMLLVAAAGTSQMKSPTGIIWIQALRAND